MTIQVGGTNATVPQLTSIATSIAPYLPNTSSGSPVAVSDEGTPLTATATALNFVGAGVTATATAGSVTVTVPGGSGSPTTVVNDLTTGGTTAALSAQQGVTLKGITDGLTTSVASNATAIATKGAPVAVQDEGAALTAGVTTMNFVGAGVTATNSGSSVTVTVPGASAAAITIKDEGTTLTTAPVSMNFVGSGVTATQSAGAVTVTVPGGSGSVTSLNGIPGYSVFNKIATGPINCVSDIANPYYVAPAAAGAAVTIASMPAGSSGILRELQMSIGGDPAGFDLILEILWDGAVYPDIAIDLGTLFASHAEAHTGSGRTFGTEQIWMETAGTNVELGGLTSPYAASYALRFPMAYSNGFVARLRTPASVTPNGNGAIFCRKTTDPSGTSKYRLRSVGQTRIAAAALTPYAASADVPLFDIANVAGVLVYNSLYAFGASSYSYLERPYFYSRDSESTPSYVVTGGEEEDASGYYYGFATTYQSNHLFVTATNNSNITTLKGCDFLQYVGGLTFTNRIKGVWTNKVSPYGSTTSFQLSYCYLYLVDTTVAFAPTAPLNVTSTATGPTTGSVAWSPSASSGSTGIASWTVTLSPGGASQTVTSPTVNFTGLTSGTAYTPTVVETNLNATSNTSSGAVGPSFTPAAVANVLTLSPSSASVANGSPVTYTVGMASGTFTGTVTPSSTGAGTFSPTSLSAPGTFNFTPSATGTDTISLSNTGGMTNPSNATLTVTTSTSYTVSDNFNRANGASLGSTQTGQAWSIVSTAGTPVAGIDTNTAYANTGTSTAGAVIAYVDSGKTSQDITLTMSTLGSVPSYSGIVSHFVDINNYVILQAEGANTPATGYGMYTKVAGAYANIGSSTGITPAAGDVLRVVQGSGTTFDFYVNGTHFGPFTATTSTAIQSSTKTGFQSGSSGGTVVVSTARIDNFSVV